MTPARRRCSARHRGGAVDLAGVGVDEIEVLREKKVVG